MRVSSPEQLSPEAKAILAKGLTKNTAVHVGRLKAIGDLSLLDYLAGKVEQAKTLGMKLDELLRLELRHMATETQALALIGARRLELEGVVLDLKYAISTVEAAKPLTAVEYVNCLNDLKSLRAKLAQAKDELGAFAPDLYTVMVTGTV